MNHSSIGSITDTVFWLVKAKKLTFTMKCRQLLTTSDLIIGVNDTVWHHQYCDHFVTKYVWVR